MKKPNHSLNGQQMIQDLSMRSLIIILSYLVIVSCGNKKETLTAIPVSSNIIRYDGFYYNETKNDSLNYFELYFFYKNGSIVNYYSNSNNVQDFVKKIDHFDWQKVNTNRNLVGVYSIHDNEISIDKREAYWGYPLIKLKGYIKSDSIISIEKLDEYRDYKFREYSPKPDSTSQLIDFAN